MQDFKRFIKNAAPVILLLLVSCGGGEKRPKTTFAATSAPVAMILEELTGKQTVPLAPPGASPHTYSPSPSDEARASGALALVYVADNSDGWADEITAQNKIKLIDLLPQGFKLDYASDVHEEHGHNDHEHVSGVDPHFWMDPLAVKALLPALTEKLAALDPKGAEDIRWRAKRFSEKLDAIHTAAATELAAVKGRAVYTYHPSMRYLLKRYGLNYAGSIELSPGKEASPVYIAELTNEIRASGAQTIFTEPQFPRKPAEMISEAAGVKLMELDPIGASAKNYKELILQNVRILANGLK